MEFMHINDSPQEKSSRYITRGRVGEGTFGEVRMGIDTYTGKQVAMKFVRIMSMERGGIPRAVFRELESLRQLGSSDLVTELYDYFPDESNLCLVLEYLPSDLYEVIQRAKCPLPVQQVKCFAHMLLSALSHCHSKRIIHRDVKPANILLSSTGQLKLGDFGLARAFDPESNNSLSHQVSTRWYRAPEVLFASRHYYLAVDVWSAGAVIAELMTLSPLFPGSNDIDQIHRVFQVMGSPTKESWEDVDDLPDYKKVSFPTMPAVDLSILIPHSERRDIDFLLTLLVLNPSRRSTAEEARNHSYFKEFPLPCPLSELPIPNRNNSSNSYSNSNYTHNHVLKKDENVTDYLNSFLV